MVWGTIAVDGPASLSISRGTMTSAKYINQQDNAICHKSKTVTSFFSDNGIEVLPWPAHSPGQNPIENVWAVLKKEVNLQDLGKEI